MQTKFRRFLINSAWGASATRGQGKGVSLAIREMLIASFSIEEALKNLTRKQPASFEQYLDGLTRKVAGKRGYEYKTVNDVKKKVFHKDTVAWGTARKCINLCLRSVFYNAFIWREYAIADDALLPGGIFDKLELPLDSYSFKGLKRQSSDDEKKDYEAVLKQFSIKSLKKSNSARLQRLASVVAHRNGICRVHLDVFYWRGDEQGKIE